MSYVFITDANCDLPYSFIQEHDIQVIPMEFTMDEISYKHHLDCREMSLSDFYTKLKAGASSQTSQINYADFTKFFKPFLQEGKDVFYICFTSGLSGTYNTCQIAVNDLKEKFPDRKIVVVDSLCASVGQGLLVYHVAQKIKQGATLEEITAFTEDIKMKCCHWFAVDDLEQLKRGGRISPAAATFAKALQIKPVLSLDDEGKLLTVGKVRGMQKVYETLIDKMKRDADNYSEQTILIGHANAIDYAKELESRIQPMVKDTMICDIGPVIGTHVGSGMVAILFLGNRNYT